MRLLRRYFGLVVVVAAAPAFALTVPGTGAVPLPAGVELSWPFAAGEAVNVLSGYGPTAGSSLHAGRNATSKANDHFALDLTLEEHPDHGRGQPVLAPVSGTVVKAGWATAGWANYGQRVILEHDDVGDGHRYVSVYAHLERIDVVEGEHVGKGEPIGALGRSCQGQVSCGSFGTPHLHWVIHQDSVVGGSGSGGSYGGHAVVPEEIDGVTDLGRGQVHVSLNTSDGAVAPPPCQLIDGADGGTLDEEGPCFLKSGNPAYWHEEERGQNDHHLWTETFIGTTPDNTGRFSVVVDADGRYELFAFVPAGAATAPAVRYEIGTTVVTVDQRGAGERWLSLGVYALQSGVVARVRVVDVVATSANAGKRLVIDALHVAPEGQGPPAVVVPPAPVDPCALVAGAELVVEEDGPCAVASGPAEFWHHETSGSGAHHQWTYAIADAAADNSLGWQFDVGDARDVEVLAVVPAVSSSQRAGYRINGQLVVVDQRAAAGTAFSLGIFAVAGVVDVVLADNTGEPFTGVATSKKLAFDALIVRTPITDGGGAVGDDQPVDDKVEPVIDSDSDGVVGVDPEAEAPVVERMVIKNRAPTSSCAQSSTSSAGLIALVLLLLRRRRR